MYLDTTATAHYLLLHIRRDLVGFLPEKQALKTLDLRHRRTRALRSDNYGRLTIYI